MKLYRVSIPVQAEAIVYVEAENETEAENIAVANVKLRDAKATDWWDEVPIDVEEMENELRIPYQSFIYDKTNSYRVSK
jgi:hypothetical protein